MQQVSPSRSSLRIRRRRGITDGYVVTEISPVYESLEALRAAQMASPNHVTAYGYYSPTLDLCFETATVNARVIQDPPPTYKFTAFCNESVLGADNKLWPFKNDHVPPGFWMDVHLSALPAWKPLLAMGAYQGLNKRFPVLPMKIHWPSKNILLSDGRIRHYTAIQEYELLMEMCAITFTYFVKTPDAELTQYPEYYPEKVSSDIFLGQVLGIHPVNEYFDRDPRRVQAFEEFAANLYDRI